MPDGLPVRADQVYVGGFHPCLFNQFQRDRRKLLRQRVVELADSVNAAGRWNAGVQHLLAQVWRIGFSHGMEYASLEVRRLALEFAQRRVNAVGRRAGDQADY